MMDGEITDLVERAEVASPVARVELLAQAVGLAIDPLKRIKLLMLLGDAAGRAAHGATTEALAGEGRPSGTPATWAEISDAATLSRDTAYRQYYGGEALSWSPAARGVRQTQRRGGGSRP